MRWRLFTVSIQIVSEKERVLVVAVSVPTRSGWEVEDRLAEITQLIETAGAIVVGTVVQNRDAIDRAFLVGKGKVKEIEEEREEKQADIVVFDAELSPSQRRNLEKEIDARVIDRTQLILDIFAQRAKTREGILQVELAQLTYSLTQLVGSREALSRLGGGIGTRGPGETKLEVDRRVIRRKIQSLKEDLDSVRRHRELSRRDRQKTPVAVAALVGYTNAGKSTLLNALTGSDVLAEDKLFATLDPTTRRARLPSGQEILLTDTVGFIRDLPHHLVAAFRATLEEVTEADIIVHVVDASHPMAQAQVEAVERVLAELGASGTPVVLALNKIDRGQNMIAPDAAVSVKISALKGEGLVQLLGAIDDILAHDRQHISLEIPYSQQSILPVIHEHGQVISVEYGEKFIKIVAEMNTIWAKRVLARLDQVEGDRTGGPEN
jgi:GTPase